VIDGTASEEQIDAPAEVESASDRLVRARRIQQILDEHIPDIRPFLDHTTPYQLLVAVILSAQCTDARVNQITPGLFSVAPDAQTMMGMHLRDLKKIIKPCGLAPAKARNIRAMSRVLVEKHAGQVPRDLALLEQLPGVGHKTASVVFAQAFDEPAFPVDTHIHRLAGRWRLSHARNVDQVERDLQRLFPRETWNRIHLQLIHFGRTVCTAKAHDPAACPVCSWAMSKARAAAEQRQNNSKPESPRLRAARKVRLAAAKKRAAKKRRAELAAARKAAAEGLLPAAASKPAKSKPTKSK
jgi:endonuclease-3